MFVSREEKGWNVAESLLMDGSHEDPEINLRRVMFWPDNILELFTRFRVSREFDLLSVDMDSYDWWMVETILKGGYRPRVIGDINRVRSLHNLFYEVVKRGNNCVTHFDFDLPCSSDTLSEALRIAPSKIPLLWPGGLWTNSFKLELLLTAFGQRVL